MSHYHNEPYYVFHRTRGLRLAATDLIQPFLADLRCPLLPAELEIVRSTVRSLNDFGQKELGKTLSTLEEKYSWATGEGYLNWMHYALHSDVSPCPIWTSYQIAFERWESKLRTGVDCMNIGSKIGEVQGLYKDYNSRTNSQLDITGFYGRLERAEQQHLSNLDELILAIQKPSSSDEWPWSPIESISSSYSMVEFQYFLAKLASKLGPESRNQIELYVEKSFIPSIRCAFRRIADLPGLPATSL